jgi:hypothetical protein
MDGRALPPPPAALRTANSALQPTAHPPFLLRLSSLAGFAMTQANSKSVDRTTPKNSFTRRSHAALPS